MVNRKDGVFNYFCNMEPIKLTETLTVTPLGIIRDSILLEVNSYPPYRDGDFPITANRKYKIFRNKSKLFLKIKDYSGLVLFDVTDIVKGFVDFSNANIPVTVDIITCKCGEPISHRYEDSISCCYDKVIKLGNNPYDCEETTAERTGKLSDGYDEYYCEKCGAVYTYEEVMKLKTKKYFTNGE